MVAAAFGSLALTAAASSGSPILLKEHCSAASCCCPAGNADLQTATPTIASRNSLNWSSPGTPRAVSTAVMAPPDWPPKEAERETAGLRTFLFFFFVKSKRSRMRERERFPPF